MADDDETRGDTPGENEGQGGSNAGAGSGEGPGGGASETPDDDIVIDVEGGGGGDGDGDGEEPADDGDDGGAVDYASAFDGVTDVDDAARTDITTFAAENGLSLDQARAFVTMHATGQRQLADLAQTRAEEWQSDARYHGTPERERATADAEARFYAHFDTDGTVKAFVDGLPGGVPPAVRAVIAEVGLKMRTGRTAPGGRADSSLSEAQQAYPENYNRDGTPRV